MSEYPSKLERIQYIDVAKGLGILLVVAGHIFTGTIKTQIFIFHIPLFFIISGFLYKQNHDYKGYFSKKVKQLMLPYAVFLIAFSIPLFLNEVRKGGLTFDVVLDFFGATLLGGRLLVGFVGVFWFVSCLFISQQIMNYLITKFDSCRNGTVVLCFIMFLFLLVSYFNQFAFPWFWLPLNINVLFASCPFLYVGYMIRRYAGEHIADSLLVLLGMLSVCVFILTFFISNNYYDMKFSYYGIPFVTFISASVISFFLLFVISRGFPWFNMLKLVLAECGKASMVIMFCHQTFQILLQKTAIFSDEYIRFIMAAGLSYMVYKTLLLNSFLSRHLLGVSR